jgi:hypothetical protein
VAVLWPLLAIAIVAAGLAVRLDEFGRYPFWNDEAWVALSTRVEGLGQFLLSLAITPPLWAASLRPLALLPGPPETTLRLLPLCFGMLTLAAAHRVGAVFAGHAIGGVLALGVVASDPLSIFYSRELKHYTAESFFCLLAFWGLMRCARHERAADLVVLSLILVVGTPFANSQLFCAPAVLGALLLSAVGRRAWRLAAAATAATLAVGAVQLLYFRVALAPRLNSSLVDYWEGAYVPGGSLADAAAFVRTSLGGQVALAWGAGVAVPAFACLGVALLDGRVRRHVAVALALLVAELAVLSRLRAVPLNEPRITLFLVTTMSALAAAGVGVVAQRLWRMRVLRPAVALALLAGAVALARRAERIVPPHQPEGLGTLVRVMEHGRRPGDGVLLYERSGYVYAYYQRKTPELVADATMTVGYRPRLDDPSLVVVDGRTPEAGVERALARHTRVWLLGSRFRDDDGQRIRDALAARTVTLHEEQGPRALLILAERQ